MTDAMLLKPPDLTAAVFFALILATLRDLLIAYPVIGFVFMGLAGGIISWVVAVEGGIFDQWEFRKHACFVTRRALLGAALGLCTWMLWQSYQPVPVLIGMLAAGMAGAFPIKACNWIARTVQRLMARGLPRRDER